MVSTTTPPPSDLRKAFREDISGYASELVTRFSTILRTAHVHGSNNEAWIPLIQGLSRALAGIRHAERTHPSITIEIAHGQVSVNRVPVRPTFAEFGAASYLAEELTQRGVGAIRFEGPPVEDEVKAFAYALGAIPEDAADPFRDLLQRLAGSNVRTLVPLERRADEGWSAVERRDRRAQACSVFLQGVTAVRELLDGLRDGRSVGFRRARRFVQSAADLLATDRGLALALTTIKNYEDYLGNHAVNVCLLSLVLGERLGFDKRSLGDLGLAALLRNVGEATIPHELLEKQGELTPEEWAQFRRFPYAAVTGLLRFRGFSDRSLRQILVAFEHQFRSAADRTLTSREFNLFSRIAQIAQAYDAMTAPRPYRPRPMKPDEALRTLARDRARTRADPVLLKAFVHAMGLYPVGTLTLLGTGEIGIVSDPPFDFASLDRPRVLLLARTDGTEPEVLPVVETTAIDERGRYRRTIVRTVDPWQHGVNVPRHLLGL